MDSGRSVVAKVRCTGRREYTQGAHSGEVDGVEVTFQPVYGGDDDKANAEWSKWTPSGEFRMTITNPLAYRQFELGKTYFATFTPAE